ncbi:hypothetical protein [Azospirillum sp. sgz302134]
MSIDKLSIRVNGIMVPFKYAVNFLSKYCMPMVFGNDHSAYDVSPVGSSFRFRHRNRNFVVFSEHQLGKEENRRKVESAHLIISEGDKWVGLTPNEAGSPICSDTDQKIEDIIILRYDSEREGRAIDGYFLNINWSDNPDIATYRDVIAIFSIGYPSNNTEYEPEFNSDYEFVNLRIGSYWSRLYLERRAATAWDLPDRIPLKAHASYRLDAYELDGYSGAPVFFIYRDISGQTCLGFAGIITDANKVGDVNVYPATVILQGLDDF